MQLPLLPRPLALTGSVDGTKESYIPAVVVYLLTTEEAARCNPPPPRNLYITAVLKLPETVDADPREEASLTLHPTISEPDERKEQQHVDLE